MQLEALELPERAHVRVAVVKPHDEADGHQRRFALRLVKVVDKGAAVRVLV